MEKELKHTSKFMSLVLRHKPEIIGLQLDEQGWANVEELITKMSANGPAVTKAMIETIVATNDKKRFAFNEDGSRIRASQGHSLEVELDLEAIQPPAILYHGTAVRYLERILATGLQKQGRQHVHLSATTDTAKAVGSRHGKPVILAIDAAAMHKAGHSFYLSANQVWLTDAVPAEFLKVV